MASHLKRLARLPRESNKPRSAGVMAATNARAVYKLMAFWFKNPQNT